MRQLLLSFMETTEPNGTEPVWADLDKEKRHEIATMLARLIAKMAANRSTGGTEEKENE